MPAFVRESMNNIAIAQETLKIIKEKCYQVDGETILLPDMNFDEVKVYSPERGEQLLKGKMEYSEKDCVVTITTEDSYEAAARYSDAMVMNFANAHKPGGGFLFGATAQEEALCRCSTLYTSISDEAAKEMYRYNNKHMTKVESDYMLYSKVCVFRDNKGTLLKKPYVTGVITVPAPNRIGAAMFASDREIADAMLRRIRIMAAVAYENGCRNLILGAWGCGAFHNDPGKVASYFKQVLMEEGYGRMFDEVCFAIYGREDGKNITAFRKCFA